jgi:hypothetical protein
MLAELLARIDELGGAEVGPVVPFRLFFEGNGDEGSFAPNLVPHPSMDNVYETLTSIESRPEVSAIVVQIDEVLEPPEWPFAPVIYVITSADAETVHEWAKSIEPDPVFDDGAYGWLGGPAPPGAPSVPAGQRPVVLLWD